MRRHTWPPAAAAALVAGTVIAGVLLTSGSRHRALAAAQQVPTRTAQVEKRTLSATVSEGGILSYRARSDGSPYSVINQAQGTYTQLPPAGRVISQGHVLYRVSDRPVVLLRGPVPAYRALSAGATGPDVAQLNADLVALGYATWAQLHPRATFFGAATKAAVEKLQASLGMAPNGSLAFGQVVFEPTVVRVTSVSAELGGRSQPGETVMQATSIARQVQIALPASRQTEVAIGNKVTITLPDNVTTSGVVSLVASVATCPSSSGAAGPTSSSGAAGPGTDACSFQGSGSATPTIAVDVSFSGPAATGTWDQAPVQVGITTATVRGVLTVPVSALLAQAGGGYAVEVLGAGQRNHLVPVSLGLFDDAQGLVQVTGSGLVAGQEVVVPST
jgi:peptidoglycan hydrolase-like protein with peptidoglycan-binding domain